MCQEYEQRVAGEPSGEQCCSCNICIPAYDGEPSVQGHGHKQQQERCQGDELCRLFCPCC